MQRLVKTQYTRSHTSGQFCDLCQTFYTMTGTRHKEGCTKVKSVFPSAGTVTKFKNMEKKLSPPIIMYADIKAVLKPIEVLNRSEGTRTIQKHEACAVSYYVKHVYNEECDEQYTFVGETCIAELLDHIQRKMDDLYQLHWTNSASPKQL
ncbi:uncharacterized protein ACN427_007849 [Glossina fuscipes fuscipes]